MNGGRIKIERIAFVFVALVLCAFLAVRVTFAWLASNTSSLIVVNGDADIDVTFYRLRDFNRDGAYNYTDFTNDAVQNPALYEGLTAALLAANTDLTEITSDNFADALASVSDAERLTYTYETDFTNPVSDVRMGSRVVYRVLVKNNSERAADVSLSLSDLMQYYYNAAQMIDYNASGVIDPEFNPDPSNAENYPNIQNYAAKYLFSVTVENGDTIPLWSVSQCERITEKRVQAKASGYIDFTLSFDGLSIAADYLEYVGGVNGECYRKCLELAKSLEGIDAEAFTRAYINAVYEAEMTYLFSSASGEGGVRQNVNLELDYIEITGTLVGQVAV